MAAPCQIQLMSFIESKWLPTSIAAVVIGMTLIVPETVVSRAMHQPVFLFGILMGLDAGMAFRVMDYLTINGPAKQRERVEQLFYELPRARRRYLLAVALFTTALISVAVVPFGDWYLAEMVGAITLYGLYASLQAFECRKIASAS